MEKVKVKSYDSLFRYEGEITVLHSEFFVKGTHGNCNPLIIYKKGIWNSFICKEKKKECLRKGLELFESRKGYQKFSKSSRDYNSFVKKKLKKRFNEVPKNISKSEFVQVIKELSKFWEFYGLTEYFHTDLAYRKSKETYNEILEENLRDFEKLKFESRETLNDLTFRKGIISNILQYVSKKFLYQENDAEYLYSNELIALFDGKKIEKDTIKERKNCYALGKFGNRIVKFSHKRALQLFYLFSNIKETPKIKGTIANNGKAEGTAIIAPMMTDKKRIEKVIKKMKLGDILIAQSTSPELMTLCHKASAIVTDQGGMLSHAAIVSREMKIPCIVGTNIATKVFKDGDQIEVDANKGTVRKIK